MSIFASNLIVKGEIDVPFSVFINGQKYYSYNNMVTISNLSRGCYNMEIYTEGARYELLYECTIDIPRNTTVTTTFTGSNTLYVSSKRYADPVIIHVTPYPHRTVNHVHHAVPVKQSVPKKETTVHKSSHGKSSYRADNSVTPTNKTSSSSTRESNSKVQTSTSKTSGATSRTSTSNSQSSNSSSSSSKSSHTSRSTTNSRN